jgi:hypothetical protein
MNSWHAIGYITLAFGFVFMFNFIYVLSQANNFATELPWINYMALSWIVAIVAMVKGSNLTITSKDE